MTAPSSARHVVIVGGGLIGCAIAWRLAQRGVRVTVIERGKAGQAASWAAAGMLSPLGETAHHPGFLALAQRSRDEFPAFVQELSEASGLSIEFGAPGKLDVGHDPHVWFADDAFVDNRALSQAASKAARNAGAKFLEGTSASSVTIERGAIAAVTCGTSVMPCTEVVICAGAWSGQITGLPRPLPVFPVRGQMLALQYDGALTHMVQSDHCYLIPRSGGRLLVGATAERVGFETGTTPAGLDELLSGARALLPALEHAAVIESWSGFRPCTPDELPILGAEPLVYGLAYATGHYRNGILLAPITARLIPDVLDGLPVPEFNPFARARFDER